MNSCRSSPQRARGEMPTLNIAESEPSSCEGQAASCFSQHGFVTCMVFTLAVSMMVPTAAGAWDHWGGNSGGTRYSPLANISRTMFTAWFRLGSFAPAISKADLRTF